MLAILVATPAGVVLYSPLGARAALPAATPEIARRPRGWLRFGSGPYHFVVPFHASRWDTRGARKLADDIAAARVT